MNQMNTSQQLANHIHQVYFGGNWTDSNLKDQLSDVTLSEAIKQVHDLNTIATLTYHIGYFVGVQLKVLQGGPLEGSDAISFDHPPLESEKDWQAMQADILENAQELAQLLEAMDDGQLNEPFVNEKYSTYYRNILGLIEHTHYHLGQIALVKKLIRV